MNKKAFTLIELLVVILIIGILSAFAMPQYRKSVDKTKMAEVLIHMKALADAQDEYYSEHDEFASDVSVLSTQPFPGASGGFPCYKGGCYFINQAYTSELGKGNYAYYFVSNKQQAGDLPSVYYGFGYSAVNADKRICCFNKSSSNSTAASLCKGMAIESAPHPVSAQASRDYCYYF